jgi:ABC-type polysaccharide/polyol phosphate export permease
MNNSTTIYDSDAIRSPALYELRELWRYRDLLRLLISNSIKTRYKRSTLGVVWTLLNPLLSTLVLTVVFSQLFRFQIQNYTIYLLVGFLFWNFYSQITTQSMNTLIWGSSLIKRIYVPRTIFALSVLGNGLVNFLLALIPLGLVMLLMHHPFRLSLLLLPLAILLMAMYTLGLALFLSTLAVFFVDIVDMYGILLTVWFYLTPIIYPRDVVPQSFALLVQLNPMTLMLGLFRSIIYLGEAPTLATWGLAAALALLSLGIGWLVFTRKVNEFAYRI